MKSIIKQKIKFATVNPPDIKILFLHLLHEVKAETHQVKE